MTQIDKKKFGDFFRYFTSQPQQVQAIAILYDGLSAELLDDQCEWIKKFREKPSGPPQSPSTIPPQALDIIAEFEGFRAKPYNDGMNVPTIGYGSTHYLNGQKVSYSDPAITEAEAKKLLGQVCEEYWGIISKSIPYWDEMNANQKSALLSFAYNLGPHFFGAQGFSTISRLLSDKDWSGVPAGLLLYVNPGTSVEAGLRRRRLAEGELWAKQG